MTDIWVYKKNPYIFKICINELLNL